MTLHDRPRTADDGIFDDIPAIDVVAGELLPRGEGVHFDESDAVAQL